MVKTEKNKNYFNIFCCIAISLLMILFCGFNLKNKQISNVGFAIENEDETSLFLQSVLEMNSRPNIAYSLRNDFKFDAENQQSKEFCWLFSSMKALETAYMQQRNEYYNFSETAMAYFNYLNDLEQFGTSAAYNSTGSFDKFDYIANRYGLVFENEVSNDILEKINESNYRNYSYIKNNSDKSLYSNLKVVSFDGNETFRNKTYGEQITIMQNFIQNYGALYLTLDETAVLYQPGTGMPMYSVKIEQHKFDVAISKHAVCLIGWNEIGFIALNSTGYGYENFETFCIPYDTSESKLDKILNTKNNNVESDNNYDNVKGFVVGEPSFVNMVDSQNSESLKNIFKSLETVYLEFQVNSDFDLNNMSTKILKGTEDITYNFDVRYYKNTSKIVIASHDNVLAGGYVVEFYFNASKIAASSFLVLSGSEISGVLLKNGAVNENLAFNLNYLTSENSSTYLVSGYDNYYLNLYLSEFCLKNDLENQFNDVDTSKILNPLFEISDIKVKNIDGETETWISTNMKVEKYIIDYNFNIFQFKLPTFSYTVFNKYISFDITINPTFVGGQKTTLTFIFFVSNIDGSTTDQNFNVVYNLNGGKNSNLNITSFPNYQEQYLMSEFKLENPTRQGYEFVGWFEDEGFTKQIKKINHSRLSDIVLFAKWDSLSIENYIETDISIEEIKNYFNEIKNINSTIIYGDSLKFKFVFRTKAELNGYDYSARIVAYYLNSKGTTYLDDFYSGNIYSSFEDSFELKYPNLISGNYKIVFKIDISINNTAQISTELNKEFIVEKKIIDVSFKSLVLDYDSKLKLPQPVSFAGKVYNEDIEKFSLNYSIYPQKDAGKYEFSVSTNNENYEINENNNTFEFEILKKQLFIDFENFEFVYNTKQQIPTFKINGIIEGDFVEIKYVKNNFVNVGNHTAIVDKTSVSNKNYYISDYEVNFKIVPAKIKITLNDVYEALIIDPQYRRQVGFDVEGNIFENLTETEKNEAIKSLNLSISSLGLTTNKYGDYKISATYDNENFDATIIDAIYHLSGNYKVFYKLPNGEYFEEQITEGKTPQGVNKEICPHSIFQKLEYSRPLEGDGTTNVFITVTIKDYTIYVIIATVVLSFGIIYLLLTRKQRRNKVS